jgi:hypothetical protein
MASPEIIRARELLKRTDETLERCRNRPARPWNVVEGTEPQFTREAQQIIDRHLAELEAERIHRETRHTMAGQNSKAWNDWAKSIAVRQCRELSKVVADAIVQQTRKLSEATQHALDKRDARIAQLEQRIATLEGTKVATLGRRSA